MVFKRILATLTNRRSTSQTGSKAKPSPRALKCSTASLIVVVCLLTSTLIANSSTNPKTILFIATVLDLVRTPWRLSQEALGAEQGANEGGAFPNDWVAVVGVPPAAYPVSFKPVPRVVAFFPFPTLPSLAGSEFWTDRLHNFTGTLPRQQASSLFARAAVFITTTGPSLSDIVPLMKPGSALVLLTPETQQHTPNSTRDTQTQHVRNITQRRKIRLFEAACDTQGRENSMFEEGGEPQTGLDCDYNRVAQAMSDAASFLYSSPALPGFRFRTQLSTSIPGTSITSTQAVEGLESWSQCVLSRGHWVRDALPRRLPWGRPQFYKVGPCDNNFLSGQEANAVADSVGPLVEKLRKGSSGEKVLLSSGEQETLEKASARWRVRESLLFRWNVAERDCPGFSVSPHKKDNLGSQRAWEPFDPLAFCEGLPGNKSILFMGDSLTEQMAQALVANLARDAPFPRVPPEIVFRTLPEECKDLVSSFLGRKRLTRCFRDRFNLTSRVGGQERSCKMDVVFVRNERLRLGDAGLPPDRISHALPFHTVLRPLLDQSDVLVLNRGAHYAATPQFMREVKAVTRFLRERYPSKLIVWRNTAPGHANCTQYNLPLNAPQDPESLPKKHGWHVFHEQNEIARAIIKDLGFVYYDVYTLSLLRADGHRGLSESTKGKQVMDCLHYCLPGPLESWVELLQNILSRVRK